MSLLGPIKAMRDMARSSGWGLTLAYAAHRLLSSATGGRIAIVPYLLVAQPIGEAGAFAAVRDDPATVVRVVGADDPLVARFPRPTQVNLDRWAAGGICYAATVKDEFAGTIWIQRGEYLEDEVRCRYVLQAPELSVWDYDVFVEPRVRLGRTMGRLWKSVDASLSAQGIRWTFSRISRFNAASVSSHARLGAVVVGRASFVRAGRYQLALLDGPRRLHFSASDSDRPTVHLAPPT